METYVNPNKDFFSQPTAITSESLTPTEPISMPKLPSPVPTSLKDIPITDFFDTTPTALENDQASSEGRIDTLRRLFLEKSADTARAEEKAGISGLTTNYNELNDQLRQIQTEQMQLQGQASTIPLQTQEAAKGRGITAGGLAPITASELRKNAIAQNALTSKGLLVSAMAETARGKLAQAEASVNRAIKLKYEPLEQELEFEKEALNRIDKNLSREDAKKLEFRRIALDERSRLLALDKEDEKIKQGFINEAISMSAKNGVVIPPLLLSRAQQAKNPSEALTIIAPYTVDAEAKADALLDRQIKREQLAKIKAERVKLESEDKTVTVDTAGRIVLPNEEAQKVNKEVTATDAYKAITKAKDSLQFLDNFDKQFKDSGTTSAVWSPKENAAIKLKYNSTILNLKEFFNLGVLNGPDEQILRGVLPDPSGTSIFNATRGSAVKEGITNMKTMIDQTLDDRYRTIKSQYGAYSPETVSILKDLDRVYVEQKAKVNPEVARLKAENPFLSDEDIISILGK